MHAEFSLNVLNENGLTSPLFSTQKKPVHENKVTYACIQIIWIVIMTRGFKFTLNKFVRHNRLKRKPLGTKSRSKITLIAS